MTERTETQANAHVLSEPPVTYVAACLLSEGVVLGIKKYVLVPHYRITSRGKRQGWYECQHSEGSDVDDHDVTGSLTHPVGKLRSQSVYPQIIIES
jgi:hypothetical protein